MANTTDKSILTAAGKALLAQLNAEEKPLIIDKMIFANVPNRPEFPQPDDVVPTDDIVHQEQVEQRGRLSADSVIYSTTLTSDVGPFEFNWTGAYCSEYGVLVTIDHHALTPKTADEPGVAGNTLVRSVVLEYKDIAEITNITVDASSWQYNATDRMKKMDSDVAQSIIDQNGKDWFIEDGFLVTPSGSAYNIKAGAGYVSGNRVSMEFDRSVQVPNKPSFIYIDAHREGTPTGEQVTLFDFVITAEEKDDYIDSSTGKDIPHFVCKIAEVLADGSVSMLCEKGKLDHYVGSINNLYTSRDSIEWVPNLKVRTKDALQLFSHTDEHGVKGYYLPNVDKLPFVTSATWEEECSKGVFNKSDILTQQAEWRKRGDIRGFGGKVEAGFDNKDAIALALESCMIVRLPRGTVETSEAPKIRTGQFMIGEGRRNGTRLLITGVQKNGIELTSNSRASTLIGFELDSKEKSNGAGILSRDGSAEYSFSEIDISRNFNFGILGYDTFWNNKFTQMRIGSTNSIAILGTNGTSISNEFTSIYCDNTDDKTPIAIKLSATKNTTFVNCNFGGTNDESGGAFVSTYSSNPGLSFVGCNFEQQKVIDGGAAFAHADSTQASYYDCTFAAIKGGEGSTIFRAWAGSIVSLHSPIEIGVTTTTFDFDAIGGRFVMYSSNVFLDKSRRRYQEYAGVTPPAVVNVGSQQITAREIEWFGGNPLTGDTRERNLTALEGAKSFIPKEGANDILEFFFDPPSGSGDAAMFGGSIMINLAARNSAGAQVCTYSYFDIFLNNEGNFQYSKLREFKSNTGNRSAEITLSYSNKKLMAVIKSNADAISDQGQLNVKFDLGRAVNGGDIDVDSVFGVSFIKQ
ncbi:phage tail-collar fiber domain-containing protein [Vibrio parahaemolyticus]